MTDPEEFMDRVRKLEKSMEVSVNLPHWEVTRLTINKLITIRNSDVNAGRDMSHFDPVIKHFLTDYEFEKYVINEAPLE